MKEAEADLEAAAAVLLEVLMRVHSHNKITPTVVLQKLSTILALLLSMVVYQMRHPVPAPAQAGHQLVQLVSAAVLPPSSLANPTKPAMAPVPTLKLNAS